MDAQDDEIDEEEKSWKLNREKKPTERSDTPASPSRSRAAISAAHHCPTSSECNPGRRQRPAFLVCDPLLFGL